MAAWLAALPVDDGLRVTGERLATRTERDPGRPVTVSWRLPAAPGEAQVLAWSIAAEGAVLFERREPAVPATLLWARPTVVAATAGELAAFAESLPALVGGRDPVARLRRRWRRLRHVWWIGEEPPGTAPASFWRALGAELSPLA